MDRAEGEGEREREKDVVAEEPLITIGRNFFDMTQLERNEKNVHTYIAWPIYRPFTLSSTAYCILRFFRTRFVFLYLNIAFLVS